MFEHIFLPKIILKKLSVSPLFLRALLPHRQKLFTSATKWRWRKWPDHFRAQVKSRKKTFHKMQEKRWLLPQLHHGVVFDRLRCIAMPNRPLAWDRPFRIERWFSIGPLIARSEDPIPVQSQRNLGTIQWTATENVIEIQAEYNPFS